MLQPPEQLYFILKIQDTLFPATLDVNTRDEQALAFCPPFEFWVFPSERYGSREVPIPLFVSTTFRFLFARFLPGSSREPGWELSGERNGNTAPCVSTTRKFFTTPEPLAKSQRQIWTLNGLKICRAGRSFTSLTGVCLIVCGWQTTGEFRLIHSVQVCVFYTHVAYFCFYQTVLFDTGNTQRL